ncbi:MAG: NUDIX hydrolase [Corynebacterium sp.]|nr:NUDIX hydrolase [Corynebacterium sp.]MDO4761697.1 NUDIX hydrolase [Corynebacterium sp.]
MTEKIQPPTNPSGDKRTGDSSQRRRRRRGRGRGRGNSNQRTPENSTTGAPTSATSTNNARRHGTPAPQRTSDGANSRATNTGENNRTRKNSGHQHNKNRKQRTESRTHSGQATPNQLAHTVQPTATTPTPPRFSALETPHNLPPTTTSSEVSRNGHQARTGRRQAERNQRTATRTTHTQRDTQRGTHAPAQAAEKDTAPSKTGRNQQKTPAKNRKRSIRSSTPARRGVKYSDSSTRMVVRDETSAGGLVISGLAEAVADNGTVDLSKIYVALIGRMDRRGRLLWSMPKGHVEHGEDIAHTAEREVWEETGIHGEVIAELGVIDYWFVSDGTRIHKTVHHHLLRYVDGVLNDEDPEVTEVAWIPASALSEHFAYADERKLARIAHDMIPEYARKEKAEGRSTPR